MTRVPRPGLASTVMSPPMASMRSCMLRSPRPSWSLGVNPGPSSRISKLQAGACLAELDPDAGGAVGVLDRVLQRLDAGEVDGALDLDRVARDADARRRGRASGPARRRSAARRAGLCRSAAAGRRRGRESAARRARVRPRTRARGPPRRRHRDRLASSSSARPSRMRSAISRCWAPSCRSRSMRARSRSAASAMRRRDSSRSVIACPRSAVSRSWRQFASTMPLTPSSSSRSSSRATSWTSAMSWRPSPVSMAVTARSGPALAALDRTAARIAPAVRARVAEEQVRRRVAERGAQRVAHVHAIVAGAQGDAQATQASGPAASASRPGRTGTPRTRRRCRTSTPRRARSPCRPARRADAP